MKMGLLGPAEAGLAPSSSDEKANLGIVSRIIVFKRDGLGPRSGWEEDDWQEEPEDVQDLSRISTLKRRPDSPSPLRSHPSSRSSLKLRSAKVGVGWAARNSELL